MCECVATNESVHTDILNHQWISCVLANNKDTTIADVALQYPNPKISILYRIFRKKLKIKQKNTDRKSIFMFRSHHSKIIN